MLDRIPRYSLYTLLIFAPLARASVEPWAITVIHILTLITLTAFIITRVFESRFNWIKTPLDKPFISILILAAITSAAGAIPRVSFWSSILLVNYIIVFYLAIHIFQTREELRSLIHTLLGLTAFLALFGLFKYLGTNPFPWWEYTDLPQNTGRLASTFGNPDHLAGWMEMALPLALGLFLLHPSGNRLVVLLSVSALCLIALILTLCRGGWLSAAISLIFMGAFLLKDRHFHHKKMVIGIAGGTIITVVIVLSTTEVVNRIRTLTDNSPQATLESRLMTYKGTLDMIRQNPLLGTGPGTYAYSFPEFQFPGIEKTYTMAHNDYLHTIAETGMLLAPLFLWMMIILYRKGLQKLNIPSRLVRGTTLGSLSGITALVLHSLGDFSLRIPANALLMTILLAIALVPMPQDTRTVTAR